jgi:hypothetical protein
MKIRKAAVRLVESCNSGEATRKATDAARELNITYYDLIRASLMLKVARNLGWTVEELSEFVEQID